MKNQTTSKWDISLLEHSIRQKIGDSYGNTIHKYLQSFAWKNLIANYHASEFERVINEALASTSGISNKDSRLTTFTKAIFLAASPDNSNLNIREAQFQAEAHIIASAQATHSLCDILSIIIYWSLRLEIIPNPPQLNKLNLFNIQKALNKIPQYLKTLNLIKIIISSSEFEYLSAYVNTTKHHSLVDSSLSVSFDAENRSGILINDFSMNNKKYKRKLACDFLFKDNKTLLEMLMNVGNSLNENFT